MAGAFFYSSSTENRACNKEGVVSVEMAATKAKMSVEEFQRLVEETK